MNISVFRGANAVSYLLISVVLGVIIWLSASNAELQRTSYPRGAEGALRIELVNLGPELVVTEGDDQRAAVDLLMDIDRRPELTADDFVITADLSELGPGRHQVEVTVDRSELAPRFRIIEWFPNRISVEIAEADTLTLPVDVVISDRQSIGIDYEIGDLAIDPESVTIVGPVEEMVGIDRVVANVQLNGSTETITRTVGLTVESNASTLDTSNLQLDRETAQVVVPISQRVGFSTLTVLPDIVGEEELINRGFVISERIITPESISVRGDDQKIEDLGGVVRTDPIDLTDFNIDTTRASIERQVGLQLPEGVTPTESVQVTVELEIRTQDGKRTVELTPIIVGLAPGYRVAEDGIVPSTVDVLLAGPIAELNELDLDTVEAQLDVAGQGQGTHEIEVIVPDVGNLTAESIIPLQVMVTIEEEQGEESFEVPVRVVGLPEGTVGVAEPRFLAVTLSGSIPTLNEIDLLSFEAIAIVESASTEAVVVIPEIIPPRGLTVERVEPPEVVVQTYDASELDSVRVTVAAEGVANNLEATLSPKQVQLQIKTPEGSPPPSATDISVTVDAATLNEGEHLLPVDVVLPAGYELVTIDPIFLRIELSPSP